MSRSRKRGYAFCAAKNKDGRPCGNKVAAMPSGAVIYRYCHVHRRSTRRLGAAEAAGA